MDSMEIMMEMIGFRRFRLKTKQERTPYFSLLGYSDSRKTSCLISLTDLAHFAIHSSRFSILSLHISLVLVQLTWPSILPARDVFDFKTFHVIARK